MKIYIGADHGGFELKNKLITWLQSQDYELEDCGAFALDESDDYPDFALAVAKKVAQDQGSKGILLCRSGAGMSIVANKVRGIRAIPALDERSAQHGVEHDDVNVISLAGDWLGEESAQKIIQTFLAAKFDNQEKRVRRVNKITNYSN